MLRQILCVLRAPSVWLALVSLLLAPSMAEAKYIGAQSPNKCPSCGKAPSTLTASNGGDAISTSEGNLISIAPLVNVKGTLPFDVIYNSYDADGSRAQIDTVMGYGWTHTYNVFLFDQLGSMFRYDASGRVTKYTLGSGGTFVATNGYFETLVRTGTTFTLTQKDKTVYTFASIAGTTFLVGGPVFRLTSIVDRNGNTTTLTYTSGNLTSVTDTYGRSITLGYNSQRKLTSVTDPAGRVTTMQYDTTGHKLTTITDPVGQSIQYSYNVLYQLTSKTDKAGRVFTYSYASTLPVSVNDGGGGSMATLSNPGNWAVNATTLASTLMRAYVPATTSNLDGRGNVWRYQYDTSGYITQMVAPDGATTTYQYDPATLQISMMTDALGRTTAYQYDAQGNTVKMTDALGHITTYTYEPVFNQMTSMTDPRGRTTTYSYDPHGNRILATDPLLQTQSWTYDSHGNVLSSSDKNGHTATYQYDTAGNRIRATDAVGDLTVMTYDAVGNMLTRTDANGHTTSYQYDGMDRVTRETDAAGHLTQYVYDGQGDRTQTTDRNGHVTTYQYDSRERQIQMTDALGHTETYGYDGDNNRTSSTDRNGHTTTYQYDVQNRLNRTTDALGNASSSVYDGVGNRISETDANGHTATYSYDALNRRSIMTDAVGDVTQYQYDGGTLPSCAAASPPCGATPGSSLVTSSIDANGKVTYTKYDAIDRVIDIVRKVGSTADTITPADAVTMFTYDPVGNVLTATEPNGNATTYLYDAVNRPTQMTNAAGDVTAMTYDGVGNFATLTEPNGNVATFTYDALDRRIQVIDSVGLVASTSYDAEGNRLSQSDGNGNATTYTYDAVNRLITTTDALGKTATTVYDAAGNMTSTTDRNGHLTTYVYDAINRRSSMTDALGDVTQYQYDPVGNLIKLTDANSHATQYQYDAVNRPSKQIGADSLARSFSYDGVGNIATRTDQLGHITTYTYSDLYFLTGRSYPSAVNDVYTYDLSGRMLSGQRGGWPVTFTYDGGDRVTQSEQNGRTLSYTYNIPGRTRTVTYPGGRTITETTDARTRLDHVDDAGSPPPIVRYTYDPGNRVTGRAYRNGTSAAYSYTATNWIVNLQHSKGVTPIAGFNYTYDGEGNKQFEQKLQDPTRSEAYQYDTIDRLITYKVGTLVGSTVPAPSTQTAYSLDPVGNWNSKTTDATTQTRVHNSTNELTQIDATNLTYDANGNLQNDGTYTYGYDEENRLTGITRIAGPATVGQYQYDAIGRRVQKIADPAGSTTTTLYFYDADRVVEEQDTGGTTQATYVYGSYVDEPLTMDRGGQTYYYHQNALWSVAAITDSTGTPVERYAYDAYGSVSVTDGTGTPVAPNSWGTAHSAIGNPWMFTGRQFDEEAAVYYYRNRYFDSAKGRFLQRDLIEYPPDDNLYRYVNDNPTKWVDFTGLQAAAVCKDCNPCEPLHRLYDGLLKIKLIEEGISNVVTVITIGQVGRLPTEGLTRTVGGMTFVTPAMTRFNEEFVALLVKRGAAAGLIGALKKGLAELGVDPDPQKACFALAICESAFGNTRGGIIYKNALGREIAKCVWKNGRVRYAKWGLKYTLPRWLGGWDWTEGWELDP